MDEWIYNSGAACYNSDIPGYAISWNSILEVGKLYAIEFTVTDLTQGKINVYGFKENIEITSNGSYLFISKAIGSNVTFIGNEYLGHVCNGCIDSVGARIIPYYQIVDMDDNIIFELSNDSGISALGNNIQYQINWQDIEDGCYKIRLFDSGLQYDSDCLTIKVNHDCTILLDWTNNDNAFGFNYEDLEFNPKLRVMAKKWHPKYPKEKTVFKNSAGDRMLIQSEITKEEYLTIKEQPEYIHDALSLGLEHDRFNVDGLAYVNEETEYTPSWRKSSTLAPVEIVIIKNQSLINNNCN